MRLKILGIETSCDECSASIVEMDAEMQAQVRVLSVATHSQIPIHQPYGGVVPEIASRNHLVTIEPMIDLAFRDAGLSPHEIDAIAVTNRPGLVGALLVGVSAAKTLSYCYRKPLVAVHHLEGHIASLFLDQKYDTLPLPLLIAIVSGGHTQLVVMTENPIHWPESFLSKSIVGYSLDDAAGEAFDKTAKLLGFPYPGGMWIDKHAQGGDPKAYAFPRALPQKDTLNFSFSGLKTAVSLQIEKLKRENKLEAEKSNLCASIQEAIIDALLSKAKLAALKYGCRGFAIVGGVAANSRLRERLKGEAPLFPLPKYCTDNAAMIAAAGAFRFAQGRALPFDKSLKLNAKASANAES